MVEREKLSLWSSDGVRNLLVGTEESRGNVSATIIAKPDQSFTGETLISSNATDHNKMCHCLMHRGEKNFCHLNRDPILSYHLEFLLYTGSSSLRL